MEFRKSTTNDIKDIVFIIKQAQEYFKENDIDQWQNGYPNEQVIINDIKSEESYVLVESGRILGTSFLSFKGEINYDKIYEGRWITNRNYGVIHRIAVLEKEKGRGLAGYIIKSMEQICKQKNVESLRIDTHESNKSMQKLLEKNGFRYCGVIYLEDGGKRVAFEKNIQKND